MRERRDHLGTLLAIYASALSELRGWDDAGVGGLITRLERRQTEAKALLETTNGPDALGRRHAVIHALRGEGGERPTAPP